MTQEQPSSQFQPCPYMPEDEIDLTQLLSVLWRRKRVITLITALCLGFSLIYSLMATRKYYISAQITPGITGYEGDTMIRNLSSKDLQTWFEKKAYLSTLKNVVPKAEISKVEISASSPRGSKVLNLNLFWPDRVQGEKILKVVIEYLSDPSRNHLSNSLRVSQSLLDKAIQEKQMAIEQLKILHHQITRDISLEQDNYLLLKKSIKTLEQKISANQSLMNEMNSNVNRIEKNTQELLKLRNELPKNTDKNKLSALMYSNIIQQNISYAIKLREDITDLKNVLADLELEKRNKENGLKKIQDRIKYLEEKKEKELPLKIAAEKAAIQTLKVKKDALSPIETVQTPFATPMPVKPKVRLILSISLVIGIFLGILGAFFWEFICMHKEKIAGQK